jgi:HSP20 family protein
MITNLAPIDRFRSFENFNKMMEDMFSGFTAGWTPTVDVKETDKEMTFVCELPGMNEKDVDVELRENLLTIRGKREFSKEERREDYVRRERSYGTFQRSFSLDTSVQADQIKAVFKDGLLTVTIPKVEMPLPQKVEVQRG